MTQRIEGVDIGAYPELRALVGAARRSGELCMLRVDGEVVALLVPMSAPESDATTYRPTTPEELEEVFRRASHRLKAPLTWDEVTRIAEEEAAQEAARGW